MIEDAIQKIPSALPNRSGQSRSGLQPPHKDRISQAEATARQWYLQSVIFHKILI